MRPTAEVNKLTAFIKCFESFMDNDASGSVTDYDLLDSLTMDYGFSEQEAQSYLQKALDNGQIYEKEVIQTRVFGRA